MSVGGNREAQEMRRILQLREEFGQSLRMHMQSSGHRDLAEKMKKVSDSAYDFHICKVYSPSGGKTAFDFAVNIPNGIDRVGLYIRKTEGSRDSMETKLFYDLLDKERNIIESEFGERLDWRQPEERGKKIVRNAKIIIENRYALPPENKDGWESRCEWIVSKLARMDEVFTHRVKNFSTSR